ncbi:unnamed protein product [Rodentolepis nana]|uniref:Thioredoxin n=1 Tax=Rodentolepis nana TaxID=102285 RepID=A0A0R3T6I9_RODNA|nr:unnamed protein product [Rodentolepis nana]
MSSEAVKHIRREDEFENLIKEDKLVVCDFFATWCGPCKMLAPKLEGLAKEHKNVAFVKIDVDELEELAMKYEIEAMPTILFFRKGDKLATVKVDKPTGFRRRWETTSKCIRSSTFVKLPKMASAVRHISDEKEFEDLVKGDKLVVCDFYATWCGPCKALAPKLEALAKEKTSVVFVKVDVDEMEDLAQKHEVSAMPTLIVFKRGAPVGRFIGADIEKVKAAIAEHSE